LNIPCPSLCQIVPQEKRGQLAIPTLLRIVHQQYCGPLTTRGICSSDCIDCKDALQSAFTLEQARNVEALLTWRLKNEQARMQEVYHDHKAINKIDALGLPVSEGNPFQALMKQY
jgi:hypothetical protein